MTKRGALVVVFLAMTALCGMGSTKTHRASVRSSNGHRVSAQNQFHFAPTKGHGKEILDRAQSRAMGAARLPGRPAQAQRTQQMAARAHGMGRRRHSNPPVSSIGFVSATQIPAGGYLPGNVALAGDFNGDGNLDVVSLVGDPANPGTFSLAVVLSNGDGSFQAAVLTPEPGNNSDDHFVVGDVNGDGFDDIIAAHQAGGGAPASFDVLLSNQDGTFTQGSSTYVITGNVLSGGTLADVNGDGKLDVVVVDGATPANVWTVLGNGDGTFSTTPTSVALSGPIGYDVVFADFNGDGWLDITANDSVSGQQTVYLATSAAAFASAVAYATQDGVEDACSTTVGDLNGDGLADIVSANCADNTITIYVNDGSGGFGSQGTYYFAAMNPTTQSFAFVYPAAVTVADVNDDGIGDVVVSNSGANNLNMGSSDVTILLGNGDGTVQVPTQGYTAGGYATGAAIVADFNGDGLADIIVPDDFYSLVYMKGYGDGTFRAAVDYYAPSSDDGEPFGVDIATGDLNGDGLPDVVLGNCCDPAVGITVFLSNPDGSLQPGVNYGSGGALEYVAVADLDGDGKLDIAATDFGAGVVQMFKGAGDGTFTVGSSFSTGGGVSGPQAVVVADFNKDGHPDLAVANLLGSNVGVLLNDGQGGFQPVVTYATCSGTNQIAVGDLDGDGFPDLVTPLPACTGMVAFLNDQTGNFVSQGDFGVGNNPAQVAVGDVNGDGFADLVITMDDFSNGHGIAVALGNGDGSFQAVNIPAYPSTLQANHYNPSPSYIKLVDLDGDGKLDLVYTNSNFGTVGVMYGVGDGTFFDPVEYPTGQFAFGLALADVNGDGAVDAVTATDDTSAVTVLLNSSGSKASPDYAVSSNTGSQTVTAGGSATFTITVTPHNFYNGTISFSCGTLPSLTTCTFGPTTLTPNGNGQMSTTLTIKTTATTVSMAVPVESIPHGRILWASLSGMGVFGLMVAGDWKKKRIRWMGLVLGVMILGMMFWLVGCGGGNSTTPPVTHQGTTPGPYTVQVSATGTAGNNGGNTSAHNLNLGLTVQ